MFYKSNQNKLCMPWARDDDDDSYDNDVNVNEVLGDGILNLIIIH